MEFINTSVNTIKIIQNKMENLQKNYLSEQELFMYKINITYIYTWCIHANQCIVLIINFIGNLKYKIK